MSEGVRVRLDLSECFLDQDISKHQWTFVDFKKFGLIQDWIRHLHSKFPSLTTSFVLYLVEEPYSLPPEESVKILQNGDVVIIKCLDKEPPTKKKKVSDLPESSKELSKIANVSVNDSASSSSSSSSSSEDSSSSSSSEEEQNEKSKPEVIPSTSSSSSSSSEETKIQPKSVPDSSSSDSSSVEEEQPKPISIPNPNTNGIKNKRKRKRKRKSTRNRNALPKVTRVNSTKDFNVEEAINSTPIATLPKLDETRFSRNGSNVSCEQVLLDSAKKKKKIDPRTEEDLSALLNGRKLSVGVRKTVQKSDFTSLKSVPKVDDVITFKILELADDYTPTMSDFKRARILDFDGTNVSLKMLTKTCRKVGKFDLEQEGTEYVEEEDVQVRFWKDLVDVKSVK